MGAGRGHSRSGARRGPGFAGVGLSRPSTGGVEATPRAAPGGPQKVTVVVSVLPLVSVAVIV